MLMSGVQLTQREEEVLALIASGYSNRQIAEHLTLALSTVKWYVRQIYAKLGAENRQHAIEIATELGLVTARDTPPNNLRPSPTAFVGRDQELTTLDRLIANPDIRIITILGPGGIGKTRLALAAAERHLVGIDSSSGQRSQGSFPDGIFFVSLAPVREVENLAPALAATLDLASQSIGESRRTTRQQLLDHMQNKHMLLVLDNFEQLIDGRDLIIDITNRESPASFCYSRLASVCN